MDNREDEKYMYIVIIVTGNFGEAGTTSHIGLKIYGTEDNSKVSYIIQVLAQN